MKNWPEHLNGKCGWINGDLHKLGWSYCNEQVRMPGESWCDHHHSVVFEKGRKATGTMKISNMAWSSRTPLMVSQIMPKDFG